MSIFFLIFASMITEGSKVFVGKPFIEKWEYDFYGGNLPRLVIMDQREDRPVFVYIGIVRGDEHLDEIYNKLPY